MKIKYIFNYMKDFTLSSFYKLIYRKPNVLNDINTINYIRNRQCSISRFGDGELRLMQGLNLEFQNFDEKLANLLKKQTTNEKCLVCVPCIFNREYFNKNVLTKEEFNYWKKFKFFRGGLWNYYFKSNKILGDAFITRFYIRKKNKEIISKYVDELKSLWHERNIIFVEGSESRLGVGNDLFSNAKTIRRILCPKVNAFDKYQEIKNAILKFAKPNDLIILAIGPTATVLAYELSDVLQCLDLGHVDIEYEWFKMNATKKELVKNKFVNEVEGGNIVAALNDKNYNSEIIYSLTDN